MWTGRQGELVVHLPYRIEVVVDDLSSEIELSLSHSVSARALVLLSPLKP